MAGETDTRRNWPYFVAAGAALLAQPYVAPRWMHEVGPALREISILMIAFGVLEKWWDNKVTYERVARVIALALAIFAIGNIIDEYRGRHHAVPDADPPVQR